MPAIISVDTIMVVMSVVFMPPRAPRSHHMAFVIAHLRISEGIWRGCTMTDLSSAFLLGLTLDKNTHKHRRFLPCSMSYRILKTLGSADFS